MCQNNAKFWILTRFKNHHKCALLGNLLTNFWKSLSDSPQGPLHMWQLHSLVLSQLSQNHALVLESRPSTREKNGLEFDLELDALLLVPYSSWVWKFYAHLHITPCLNFYWIQNLSGINRRYENKTLLTENFLCDFNDCQKKHLEYMIYIIKELWERSYLGLLFFPLHHILEFFLG